MRIVESRSRLRQYGPGIALTAASLAILIAVPCAALAPMFLLGALPWSADELFFLPPWSEERPTDLTEPRDADPAMLIRHYPWYRYLNEHAGEPASLLWNPLEGGGTPFFAIWRTRCLSPFSIPFYLLPLESALRWSVTLKLVVAGLCAYYAARKLELQKPFAVFAGVSFQLSPPIMMHLGDPISDSAVWLPLLILFVDAWVTHKTAPWRAHAIVSVLILLGGAPEVGLCAFILALLYPINLMATRRLGVGHGSWAIACYMAMTILSVLIAAAQMLPTILTALDVRLHTVHDAVGFHWWHVASAAFMPASGDRAASLMFVGWAALVWAPLWIAVRPWLPPGQCRRIEGLLIAGAITAVLAGIYAVFDGRSGLFIQRPFAAALAPLPFILAWAASAACEEWSHLDERQTARSLRRLAILVPIYAIGILALLPAARVANPDAAWWHFGQPFAVGIVAVLIIAWTVLRPSYRTMGYAMVVLAIVQGLMVARNHVQFDDPDRFFPETRFIASLRAVDERVAGTPALAEWPLAGNGIEQIYAPSGATTESQEKLAQRLKTDPLFVRRTGSPELLLDRAAIRGPFASVRPDLRIESVLTTGAVIFEDLQMATRAHLVIQSADEAAPMEILPAEVVSTPNNAEVHVIADAPTAMLLVLANNYLPGWKAYVDDEPAMVEQADAGFLGVRLGAGTHNVRFEYRPWPLVAGAVVSALALLVFVATIVRDGVRWWKARPEEEEEEVEYLAS